MWLFVMTYECALRAPSSRHPHRLHLPSRPAQDEQRKKQRRTRKERKQETENREKRGRGKEPKCGQFPSCPQAGVWCLFFLVSLSLFLQLFLSLNVSRTHFSLPLCVSFLSVASVFAFSVAFFFSPAFCISPCFLSLYFRPPRVPARCLFLSFFSLIYPAPCRKGHQHWHKRGNACVPTTTKHPSIFRCALFYSFFRLFTSALLTSFLCLGSSFSSL